MKPSHQIIMHPVISEKGTELAEKNNQYVFSVGKSANKIEIKKAIQDIYNVTVLKVNTMNVQGKKKRVRAQEGRTSSWKKAIVTLKDGDKIEYV
ncbi:MAG: 50S ribosomal protein L23 [Candidatus Theseobacter exili]|nr:50S ribosomal protein L23 [Candidatus Theseobacter exili]